MDQTLAISGTSAVDESPVIKLRFIHGLTFLFFIACILDIEYDLAFIKGQGEVLGQTSILVGNELKKIYTLPIPLKLQDLISIGVLLIIALCGRKTILPRFNAHLYKATKKRFSLILLGFLWILLSVWINANSYTDAQLTVMTLHWAKLLQAVLTGAGFALLLLGIGAWEFWIKTILLGILTCAIILYFNQLDLFKIGVVAGDRMETYGTLAAFVFFISYCYERQRGFTSKRMSLQLEALYGAAALIASLAIFSCGKRGVVFSYFICICVYLVKTLFSKNKLRNIFFWAIAISCVISIPKLYSEVNRSVHLPYNAVHGTAHRDELATAYQNISRLFNGDQRDLNRNSSNVSKYNIPIVSNLDYSGAERIGKIYKSLKIIRDDFWVGSGYWGVQYRYGFLPDTALQLIIEIGFTGVILLLLAAMPRIQSSKDGRPTGYWSQSGHSTFYVLLFAALSLFCNPFYMSRFMMSIVFIYVAISHLVLVKPYDSNQTKIY
jgi:hypothetical protein